MIGLFAVVAAAGEGGTTTGTSTASWLVPALAGLAGVTIGGLITAETQHRQWLRSARLEAYARLLEAYDVAVRAAGAYAGVAMAATTYGGQDLRNIRQFLSDEWEKYKSAEDAWEERRTSIELIGTEPVERASAFMNAELMIVFAIHYDVDKPDFDPASLTGYFRTWLDRADSRQSARRGFIQAGTTDLAAGPMATRVRGSLRRLIGPARGRYLAWREKRRRRRRRRRRRTAKSAPA